MKRSDPVRRICSVVALLFLVMVSGFAAPAHAADDPTLNYWTVETTHFNVHYPKHLERIATRIASLAESVYPRLSDALAYTPTTVTEVVVTDDTDSANGSATSVPYNTVRLYVTAPDDLSPLNDYDDWYLELVTHEFTHILHTDNVSGVPAILNAIFGKTYSPNQIQPRWILEGLAVVSETEHTSGGRLRSSLFDMFLRADVLDDRIAGIDQISSSAMRYPQGNLWYLYGSQFLGFITGLYGPNTMRAVAADYGASLVPWGINRAIRRATGKTYVELYEGFKDHIRRRYADQMKVVASRGLREGRRLTSHGAQVSYPRFVPRHARASVNDEIVYYRGDQDERTGLYRFELSKALQGTTSEELVARTSGISNAAFVPSGGLVFSSTSIFRNVYAFSDLFSLGPGQSAPRGDESFRKRLTVGVRALYPDVSPDGRLVAFCSNSKGTSTLEVAALTPEGELRDRRVLVAPRQFEQSYTPRFSPDGRLLAYSAWTAGGYRDIRVVDLKTGAYFEVSHDRSLDVEPVFSNDGKTLYFASDRTGIFNIYAYDLESRSLNQVTNVRTGAFQPAVSPDDKTLVYVGYTSYGFDLYALPLEKSRYLKALPAPLDRPDPPTEPSQPHLRYHPYNPLPTLTPRAFSLEVAPGRYDTEGLTVSVVGSDVVGHHSVGGTLTYEPSAPGPQLQFSYAYRRLPFDFSASLFQTYAPRSGYRINEEKRTYDERNLGVTTGLSFPIHTEFATHSFGLSFSLADFRGELPVGSALDPYATQTSDPASGLVNVVHTAYAYSDVEGGLHSAGASRGMEFRVGVDFAGVETASTYSVRAVETTLSKYFEMPWPGHQTLALKTGAAISAGTYTRGSTYGVGGYDLEKHDLLDTITSGVFNGAFVLRGYKPNQYSGRAYLLQSAEYRTPLLWIDRGLSTLPVYFRRIDANLFFDYGGAFEKLRSRSIRLFHDGYLIDSPDLHGSVGAELWFNLTLGYSIGTQIRLGYAHGFSRDAVPGGQWYLIAASAF